MFTALILSVVSLNQVFSDQLDSKDLQILNSSNGGVVVHQLMGGRKGLAVETMSSLRTKSLASIRTLQSNAFLVTPGKFGLYVMSKDALGPYASGEKEKLVASLLTATDKWTKIEKGSVGIDSLSQVIDSSSLRAYKDVSRLIQEGGQVSLGYSCGLTIRSGEKNVGADISINPVRHNASITVNPLLSKPSSNLKATKQSESTDTNLQVQFSNSDCLRRAKQLTELSSIVEKLNDDGVNRLNTRLWDFIKKDLEKKGSTVDEILKGAKSRKPIDELSDSLRNRILPYLGGKDSSVAKGATLAGCNFSLDLTIRNDDNSIMILSLHVMEPPIKP